MNGSGRISEGNFDAVTAGLVNQMIGLGRLLKPETRANQRKNLQGLVCQQRHDGVLQAREMPERVAAVRAAPDRHARPQGDAVVMPLT